jgi:hypothetical protein
MKFIYPVILLILVVLVGFLGLFYSKLKAIDQRMAAVPTSEQVEKRLGAIEENHNAFRNDFYGIYDSLNERLEAIEAGQGERELKGPKTLDYFLTQLEQQIHRKRDSNYLPDEEMAAQKKINKVVGELELLKQDDDEVIPAIIERIRVSRDPYVRAFMIRDVVWRLGPDASKPLMELFRDRAFPSNLRVLAAAAAVKSGGRKNELLKEFKAHFEDPKEELTVKTGLAHVFKENPYDGMVDLLINAGRNAGYPVQHRTACLLALERYDHPRVIKALAEIMENQEDDEWVVNFAIQIYSQLMKERAVPFFKTLLQQGKLSDENKAKVENILKEY